MLSNRLGFDYQITKSWSMGIQYIGSNNKPNINDSNNIDLSNKVNVSKGSIKTSGESTRKRVLNSINYHSNIDLDTLGRSISFDIDYLNYNSNNNRTFNSLTTSSNQAEIQNGYFSANNSTNQKIENYAAQINIEHPLKLVKLSYGSKISYSKTKNLVEFFNTTSGTPILDKMQSNLFEYKENIQALYFSGNKKFVNNKYEVEVGLRAENTQTEGVSISLNKVTPNKFLEFFPTIYLGYTLNENKSFYINYGRRITRPNFNSLNPFKWFSDPYTYVEGNPNLRPTYSHNLELNFSYKDFLFTNLSYTKNKDGSGQVPILDQADFIQRITRLNFFDSYSIGLQQVYVFKKYSWLESQNSFALFFQRSDSKIFPLTPKSNQGFGASFSSSNTITINKQKTIFSGLEFQHNFPNQSGDLVYNYAITQLNLNFKMLLLEKKLQISVAGNNLFKAFDFNNISTRNYIEATYNGYYDTQDLRLNLMFKFGSNKVNVNQRKISNEDEKNRVK